MQQANFLRKFGISSSSIIGININTSEIEHIFSAIACVSKKFFPTQFMWSFVYMGAMSALGHRLKKRENMK